MTEIAIYTQSTLEGVILILSHFALVPSFIYLWMGRAFPEATFIAVLFLSSSLYHFCQAGFFCMVDSFDTMQKADHFFVYSVVFWLMLWFIGLSLESRICIFVVVEYFLFPLLLFYVHSTWLGIGFVIFLVVAFLLFTGIQETFPRIHIPSLLIVAVLLIFGVVVFIIGGEPGEENYAWAHTLWHVLVFFSIFWLIDARYGNSWVSKNFYYIAGGEKDRPFDSNENYVLIDPKAEEDEDSDSEDDGNFSDSDVEIKTKDKDRRKSSRKKNPTTTKTKKNALSEIDTQSMKTTTPKMVWELTDEQLMEFRKTQQEREMEKMSKTTAFSSFSSFDKKRKK
jgi:hypothetical protein